MVEQLPLYAVQLRQLAAAMMDLRRRACAAGARSQCDAGGCDRSDEGDKPFVFCLAATIRARRRQRISIADQLLTGACWLASGLGKASPSKGNVNL